MNKSSALGRARVLFGLVLTICLASWLTSTAVADTSVTVGTDATKYVLRGAILTPDGLINGEMVIEGDTITCVAVTCTRPPGASVLSVTDAYIFPGFIDAHNHVGYNFLPKWTPPKLYQNRGQWQIARSYKDFKKPYDRLKSVIPCELVKYGELRALISGVTTIQGTSPNRNCFRTLVRNAENQNELGLPPGTIRTFILDISSFDSTIDWNVTKSFVVHLAEGIDEKSRREFQTLKQKGLLTKQTVIVHGTAFGAAEFQEMGQAGAKLVWSPESNLVLYDKTTNIPLALQNGVMVSLGVDWNPSGSNNIFDELRIAATVNEEDFASVIPLSAWSKMITVNPATALALEGKIGKLAPGLKADLTIVRSRDADPNASLLKNHPQDIEMVWIGGELLYSNRSVIEKLKPGQCELLTVYGSRKRICVKDTSNPPPQGGETLKQIRDILLRHYPGLAPLTPR